MAGSKSNYLAKKLIEETIGAVAYTSAANTYFGLWTAALDDTSTGSTGSEATYGSYARTLIGTANNQTDAWNAATGTTTATVTNKNAVTFPTSSGTANTLTYIGCLDASTTGNMLYWEFSFTVRSLGATAALVTAAGSGYVMYGNASATATVAVMGGTIPTTVDDTVLTGILVSLTWGTNSASNTATCTWMDFSDGN
jgi:hypothetical protein